MAFLFLQELFLFALVQTVGIFAVLRSPILVSDQDLAAGLTAGEIIFFLAFFVLAIFLISKFSHRAGTFFRVILAVVIFIGSQTVFFVLNEGTFSILAAALLTWTVLRFKIVLLHNIGIVLALSGVGAVIGFSLTPISVVILLVILSFYDIIAVYKTKHMVKVAEDMIKAGAISGLVIPQAWRDWLDNLQNVRPGGKFMILGSGDVILPVILVASVISYHNLMSGLIVSVFSFIGLFLTFYLFINQKTKRPMAALPPIAAALIIGYLVSIVL